MSQILKDAIQNMLRTEVSTTYVNINSRMEHAIMGIADESGELISILLKARFYNKPVDMSHYKDELGDILWYLCLAADELAKHENKTPEEIFQEILNINRAKLKIRYPNKYSNEQATNRDLGQETQAVQNENTKTD